MRTVIVLVSLLLGGCVQHTLVVRGEGPIAAWVAENAVKANNVFCTKDGTRNEFRSAKVTKENKSVYVDVRHTCG